MHGQFVRAQGVEKLAEEKQIVGCLACRSVMAEHICDTGGDLSRHDPPEGSSSVVGAFYQFGQARCFAFCKTFEGTDAQLDSCLWISLDKFSDRGQSFDHGFSTTVFVIYLHVDWRTVGKVELDFRVVSVSLGYCVTETRIDGISF